MTIACPICQVAMNQTANPNMLICNRRKVYVKELDCTVETTHAMIYINPEGRQAFKVIEVMPYTFEIHDTDELKQTRIIKVVDPAKKKMKDRYKSSTSKYQTAKGPRTFERENLITVPGVVNCDWHNKEAVFERVKMYMVFS